jgi:neutral ceramidase
MLNAGFAEVDITPPAGAAKIGNLRYHVGRRAADSLLARAAVLENGGRILAFVALDALSVSRRHVAELREELARDPGLRPDYILVAATHTHAGGALVRCGVVRQDAAYRDHVTNAALTAVRAAHAQREPARWASARAIEPHVARNRRVVQRDGTVRTHGALQDRGALWIEGPIDPEISIFVACGSTGEPMGCIVCYACHPTDHGDDDVFSAGFPGVLAGELREHGIPVTLYFNGAQGNVHPMDPSRNGHMPTCIRSARSSLPASATP